MAISLCTKAEYKSHLNITTTNEDVIIEGLIIRVSKLIKTYCNRTFLDYVDEALEEYSSGGNKEIFLKETPVISLKSVEYSSDNGNTYTELVEFTDYFYNLENGSVCSVAEYFPAKYNGYKITYNAGYEALPEDLKLAVFDLITYYRKNDGAIHSNKAPGTNSVQIEYVTSTSLPANIRRILDLYKLDFT